MRFPVRLVGPKSIYFLPRGRVIGKGEGRKGALRSQLKKVAEHDLRRYLAVALKGKRKRGVAASHWRFGAIDFVAEEGEGDETVLS